MDALRRIGSSYTLERLIGEGASGQVWYATDGSGRPVAVKLLRHELASDRVVVQRFIQERGVLESVRHPNVVAVHDLVVEGSTLAIVMDFVQGTDLRAVLRARGTLPPAEAAEIIRQVAVALHAVRRAGIVHRDVKPENVLMEGATRPRLTDFGIAKIVGAGQTATMLLGTPLYMAPELAWGQEPTAASDVYSLGIMLYELLCGITPFAGRASAMATLSAHATELPGRPSDLPDQLWLLLTGMLHKDPGARPPAAAISDRLSAEAARLQEFPAAVALTASPPTTPVGASQASAEQLTQMAATQLGNRSAPWSAGGSPEDSWPTVVSTPGRQVPLAAPPVGPYGSQGLHQTPYAGPSPYPSPYGGGPQAAYVGAPGYGPAQAAPPSQTKRRGLVLGIAVGCLALAVAVAITILVISSRSTSAATATPSTSAVAALATPTATATAAASAPAPSAVTVTVSASQSSPAQASTVAPTVDEGDRAVMTYIDRFSARTLSASDMATLFTPTVHYYSTTQTRAELYTRFVKTDLGAYNRTYERPQFVSYGGATTYAGQPASTLNYSVDYHKPNESGRVRVVYTVVKDDDGVSRIAAVSERPA